MAVTSQRVCPASFERALALAPALDTARSAIERIRAAHPRPGS